MKLITRDIDYAIRAMVYIAEKSEEKNEKNPVSITELVERLDVPRPFMRKILQNLSNAGILKSHKGNRGGFELILKPEEIFLFNLVEIFQGKFSLNECLFKKDVCPDKNRCYLKKKIDSIEDYVGKELKKVNLKSLIEGE